MSDASQEADRSPSPAFRKGVGWACWLIVLMAFAAYRNSFSIPFQFDDIRAIVDNSSIHHLSSALSPPLGTSVSGRPVLNLSLALSYALSRDAVWGYHALNLAIHIFSGLTLFGIVRRTIILFDKFRISRTTDAAAFACAVALIWTVHPLQTESVSYIVQRAESLMGLFYLLTLYFFVRYAEGGGLTGATKLSSSTWGWFSVIACLLGMATKEVMVSAPIIVVLYDAIFVSGGFWNASRRHHRLYLGLASTWLLLAYFVAATGGNRSGSVGFGVGVAWWSYALTQFRAIVTYLWLSFWPHPLIFDRATYWATRPMDVIPYALIVLPLLAVTLYLAYRRAALGFLGVWFFAVLAPSSSVIPGTTQMIVEHRMYLPLAAVLTAAVAVLYSWVGRRALWGFLFLAVPLVFLTISRNRDYKSSLALWSDTVAKAPGNSRARNNLGLALLDLPGHLQEAIGEFRTALRLDPKNIEAHQNLGNALLAEPEGKQEAIAQFEEALRINPGYTEAQISLGTALASLSQRQGEAIALFEAAVRAKPNSAEAHNDLGKALLSMPSRRLEAVSELETALRLKPELAEAHYNVATALAGLPGRENEVRSELETALRIKPDMPEAHDDLGKELIRLPGHLADGISQFEEALRERPDLAEAHYNLGTALLALPDRRKDAITELQAATRIKPDYVEAHHNLGYALLDLPGRHQDAIDQFKTALRIDPDNAEIHNSLGSALLDLPQDREEAIAQFEASLRINPNYVEAHYNLGTALMDLPGHRGEAIAHFKAALRLNPALEPARQMLGRMNHE